MRSNPIPMHRQPCESVGICDSTTEIESRYSFETQNMSRVGLQMMSTTSSHVPIEHPSPDIKQERVSSPNLPPVTVTPKASTEEYSYDVMESKGPDSTYPVTYCPTPVTNLPPPYAVSPFHSVTPNHVQSYAPASPHPSASSPDEIAIHKLQPVWSKPVTILGHRTLFQLGLRLDPEMLPALNWKMMAETMLFNNWEIAKFERAKSPTMEVIQAWARMGAHTIGDLISILKTDLDRPDVITDIPEFILKDATRHDRSLRKYSSQDSETGSVPFFGGMSSPPLPHLSVSTPQFQPSYSQTTPYSFPYSASSLYMPSSFSNCDTYMEKPSGENSSRPVQVDHVQPSEPAVTYDAFVLCNIADKEFVVDRFLPKVEGEAQLKLCFADRDITPGQFAFTDAMNYMFRRSRKLVVILSDDFFASKEHEWQSNLAISRDPASRQQTIIPVKYKKLNNRNIFDYLGCCDLTRTMKEQWFWDKIIKGIKA